MTTNFKDYLGTMCLEAAYRVKNIEELKNIAPYKLAELLYEPIHGNICRADEFNFRSDLETFCDDFRDEIVEIIEKFYNII